MRVLIVEDDEHVRSVLERGLADRGFTVTPAASAEEGLAAAAAGVFDAILLDVNLPGLTGLAALPLFAGKSGAPIIVMTGHSDEELKKDAALLGARGFIAKPVELSVIEAVLRDAAKKSS